MFNLSEWVADGLVKAYKANEFTRGQVVKLTADYTAQGTLTQTNAEQVAEGVAREDADRAKAAEQHPILPEEPTDPSINPDTGVEGGPEPPAPDTTEDAAPAEPGSEVTA